MKMDSNIVSALSAVLGSVVAGSASIASSWFTLHIQNRRERVRTEVQKRETLYAEFIAESSKLVIDSLDHTLDNPEAIVQVYSLQNRIRLTSTDAVVNAADAAVKRILKRYFAPKMTQEELHAYALSSHQEPLEEFAKACRKELADLRF